MKNALLSVALLSACSEYDLNGEDDDNVVPDDTAVSLCPTDPPSELIGEVDETCLAAFEGSFTPQLEWAWENNPIDPGYDQVMTTPIVADIDADGTPDILFTAFVAAGAEPFYWNPGVLVAISGRSGDTLFSLHDIGGHPIYGAGGVAVGDLDRDGAVEILVSTTDGVACATSRGSLLWVSAAGGADIYGFPALADLDADGVAEVIYGRAVMSSFGRTLFELDRSVGGPHFNAYGADLDGDGRDEVIAGNTVWNPDGSLRWDDGSVDGWTAVGDLDADGDLEVVKVYTSGVQRIDDGRVSWDVPLVGPDWGGGPPTLADLDGDGDLEIGFASKFNYRAMDADGSVIWSHSVVDSSSGMTGSSVYDFEGDGAAEVVYADQETLFVWDGATGDVKLAWDDHSSGTLFEYPVIADVDGDGAAEIILAENDYYSPERRGIAVIGDADGLWTSTRGLWTQHAFASAHVADDASLVPSVHGPFRANPPWSVAGSLPDLAVGPIESCAVECDAGRAWVWIPVQNGGASESAPTTVVVRARNGSDEPFAVIDVPVLAAGESRWLGPVEVGTDRVAIEGLRVRIDDESAVAECDEDDNEARIDALCP